MTNWRKMIRDGGFLWVKYALILSGVLLSTKQLHAEETMKTNYTVSFNAVDALCLVKVNDMLVTDNGGMWKGPFTLGQTVSSYLQNGENTLSIAMLHKTVDGDYELPDNMWCSAKIQDVRRDGSDEYIAAVKLIVQDGKITPDTTYYSGQYTSFGDSPRSNLTEKNFREVSQTFYVGDLPEWPWTTATPVTESDIPAIKVFYESLQNDFKRQDLPAIYQKTRGIWESLAAEQGSTPQRMWESMDYKGYFTRGYKAAPIDWTGFELNSYMGGRIFRFEKGYGRISPLLIEIDKTSDDVFISTPYLSIIDGKVIVVN